MSRETNEAIAICGAAARKWHEHCLTCSACGGIAKERRRPDLRCRSGAALHAAWQTACKVVKANRELDALPVPGQGELGLDL